MSLKKKNQRRFRIHRFQPLEDRRLMAADIDLVNDTLQIVGTESADSIHIDSVQLDGQTQIRAQVTFDGGAVDRLFAAENVSNIHVDALAGSDTFVNNTSLSSTVFGRAGNDTITGGSGYDILYGESGDDQIRGRGGNDRLAGRTGDDVIFGDEGNDIIRGDKGNDVLDGGAGFDRVYGSDGVDELFGREGVDHLYGEDGNDSLYGNLGRDRLIGGGGNDSIHGGEDNDRMWGQGGNDLLRGGEKSDLLAGGGGHDTLEGGAGNDNLYGHRGNDTYVFAGDSLGRDRVQEKRDEGVDTFDLTEFAPLGADTQTTFDMGLAGRRAICLHILGRHAEDHPQGWRGNGKLSRLDARRCCFRQLTK